MAAAAPTPVAEPVMIATLRVELAMLVSPAEAAAARPEVVIFTRITAQWRSAGPR